MKIGILCYPTYGGSGIVATELGMSLANKGYEVHFISSALPARLDITNPNIFFHKVNVQTYPLFQYQPYDIALSSMIYRVVNLYKLDILHAHYAIPYAYAAFTAKQMLKEEGKDVPLVTTLHGTDITLVGQHPSYKHAVEFSINQSDTITSVSESLKKDTLQFFNIKKDIQVITNFIDNSEFDECVNCDRNQFANDDEKILIHVSNLRPVKRIEEVLAIFKNVLANSNDEVIIEFNENMAKFTFGNNIWICRLIDGKYPNYSAVIPKENPNVLTINRSLLLSSIRRASIMSNKSTNQVRFKLSGNILHLHAEDTEYANKADMQIPCDYNGEDINIGFSSKFLTEMLSVLSSDDITMKMSQPNRPGIIEPVDGLEAEENILMLSMPVIGM